MIVSDASRSRLEMIGKDQLALALASWTVHKLGITEQMKGEAIAWVREQEAERHAGRKVETQRFHAVLRWTIVAAVASVIAAITGIVALITGVIAFMR